MKPVCWEQPFPPLVCCAACLTAFLFHTRAEELPVGQATCSGSHVKGPGLDSYLFDSRSGIHENTGAGQNTKVSWLERSPEVNRHFSKEAVDRPQSHRQVGLLILSCREYWGDLKKKGPSPVETLGTGEHSRWT